MTEHVSIEVACAWPDRQFLQRLSVAPGTTAAQAVVFCGVLEQFPQLDAANLALGIFGKSIPAAQVLRDGDRVEIYRPLLADPKAVRRQRAEAGKGMGKGAAGG